jgi:isoleucyl-tRNA synthetase
LVSYHLQPDNKVLGPRFGSQFPLLRAALSAARADVIAASVLAGQSVSLELNGQMVELAPAEIIVQTQPVEGLSVAVDKQIIVAIDTVITPELQAEGLTREIVRRLQQMRKDAGFNIDDRISVYYVASNFMNDIFTNWSDYIRMETLALSLINAAPPQDAYQASHKIDGVDLILGVKRIDH